MWLGRKDYHSDMVSNVVEIYVTVNPPPHKTSWRAEEINHYSTFTYFTLFYFMLIDQFYVSETAEAW